MSSGLLYLAIVGVWAGVLVPMWVRRSDAGEARGYDSADLPIAARAQRRARARVVARRRRRLSGITLLFAVTVLIAITGLAPWWIVPVPGLALVGYLGCLRAAATYDLELAERERLRQEEFEPEYGEGAAEDNDSDVPEHADDLDSWGVGEDTEGTVVEEERHVTRDSRVIEFPRGGVRASVHADEDDELFDQYADEPRRAVGE